MRRARKTAILAELVQQHLDDLAVRGYSVAGLRGRRTVLTAFARWCGACGVTRPRAVTAALLTQYQAHLEQHRTKKGKPLAVGTIRLILDEVHLFCRWLSRQRYLACDPADRLVLPRRVRRLPGSVFNEDEIERVIGQPDTSCPLGLRDRAMMETLYSTALRCGELARLALYDIDHMTGMVLVRQGKGRKDRLVPIGQRALYWIDQYLSHARPLLVKEPDDGVLFVSARGHALSLYRLTDLVGRYVRSARTGKTGACHIFRHTAATLMLRHGADIRHIQAMLGHASLEATQTYTHIAITDLRKVHAETHPAELEAKGE